MKFIFVLMYHLQCRWNVPFEWVEILVENILLNDKGCNVSILSLISAMAIHGNKSQGARTKALAEFKTGDLQVLVATDIAARGIDIDQLPHVVNFELPNVSEDYVHRIGRTGRAGATGEAVSLVCVDENGFLREIEKLIKRDIPKEIVPGFAPDPSEKPEPIVLGRMILNTNGSRSGGGGGRGSNPRGGGGGGGRGAPRGGPSSGSSREGGGGGGGDRAPRPSSSARPGSPRPAGSGRPSGGGGGGGTGRPPSRSTAPKR